MKMMMFVLAVSVLAAGFVAMSNHGSQSDPSPAQAMKLDHNPDVSGSPKRPDKVVLTEAEWRKKLTPAQFKILRSHGTEPAFCGVFHDNKKNGVYHCAGCDLPLFKSDAKFDSGTGWPSFFQPYNNENVWQREDRSYGMIRYEVLCARCDGHLGHVFTDGPKPSGLRYCINSDGLTFVESK